MAKNIQGFGWNESLAADVASAKTAAVGESGLVQNVTATLTVTLPATVVGTYLIFRVGKEGITLTIAPNASDNIIGNGQSAVDNKALIFTNQPAGSYVTLLGDGTTAGGWVITNISGTATRQP